MKTASRQSVCLSTRHRSKTRLPPEISADTVYTTKVSTDRYLHVLSVNGARTSSIRAPSAACDYVVKMTNNTTSSVRVMLYTDICGSLEWMADVNDVYAKTEIASGASRCFAVRFKLLVVVSLTDAVLDVLIIPVIDRHYPFDELENKRSNGHVRIALDAKESNNISSRSKKYALSTAVSHSLHPSLFSPPGTTEITDMSYYLNFNSLLTLYLPLHKYPSYSVPLVMSKDYRAVLKYDIELSASAGEAADITLTAIESLSYDSYSIIKDETGKEITHVKSGIRVTGEFILPLLCSDVGIHIYTPYGFSADIGEDPRTSLAKFHMFEVRYVYK